MRQPKNIEAMIMSTLTQKQDAIYRLLQQHLDKQAVGFPATRSGADIRFLEMMFTPDEARVALKLSYEPTPQNRVISDVAADADFPADQTAALLESAFQKGAIGWKLKNGIPHWYVMPVVIGMYEAQDGNPSREFLTAAESYMQTMQYGKAFLSVNPSQMRTIPIRKSVTVEHYISTYDEIRSLVESSKGPFVILKCICREAQRAHGKHCKQTSRLETCLGMGDMASMALRRNHGREISADEALAILQQNEDDGLVLQPANEQKTEFVCSCCGCCCGMLRFQKMLPHPVDFWTSNFYAYVNTESCTRCGVCAKRCQVNAVALNGPSGAANINWSKCIGCGLCVTTCPKKAISLFKKTLETVPPKDEERLYETIKTNRKNRLGQLWMLLRLLLRMRQ
jgi:NAD-dependent dihydropyrimidine dehydrogenase PreA subunit